MDQIQPNYLNIIGGLPEDKNAKTNRPKWGEGQKKNLGPWTKLNQILYTKSVSPLKTKNAKTNHPKSMIFYLIQIFNRNSFLVWENLFWNIYNYK